MTIVPAVLTKYLEARAAVPISNYGGEQIYVNENGMFFTVKQADEDVFNYDFSSKDLDDVKRSLDARFKRKDAQRKAKKISLEVITRHGSSDAPGTGTITGHHAGGQGFTGLKKQKSTYYGSNDAPSVYVDHPHVRNLMTYQTELKEELEATANTLNKFEFRTPSPGYGSDSHTPTEIEELNDKLVAVSEAKWIKAERLFNGESADVVFPPKKNR